ncbi:hypothetical protein ID866_4443 [Astraeus odoratus]|nr:hypothetical protein ID866_4443 [Astraeus odoratus]
MTSFTTSTSPQWDNRNRGFISPSELQQLRQASPGRAFDLLDLPARRTPPQPTMQPASPDNNNNNNSSNIPAQSHPQPSLPSHLQLQSPAAPAIDPQPRPAMPSSAQSHARTSSFFSFRHRHSQDQQSSPSPISPQPPAASHNKRPSSSNGAALSDFGPPPPPMGQSQSMGPGRPPTDSPSDEKHAAQRRSSVAATAQPSPSPVHPEIRSVVQLTVCHARKVYFSGPLVKRVERMPDGQRPTKDERWVDVWAQLGGTTLSIWDMREVEEANKQGREVPPMYFNVTDAFVQVLGAITMPAVGDQPPQKFTNVLTLNTAGSNLLLFCCPSTQALVSWATALRLAAWEKSRLEEIYTAHLIRITLPYGKDTRSTLVRGRMEGWVRIRVSGQTDWKRMWMVVSAGSGPSPDLAGPSSSDGGRPGTTEAPRKKRMSNLFSRDHQDDPLPLRPLLAVYASPKSKDKKQPLLTLREVSQAFAVYPERPELINRSTLMKLEGYLGEEDTAGSMRNRQGWLLVMPELEVGNTQPSEMLKWLIAIHDAFELYGRPKAYTWDPREQLSMMFAYPVGPGRDLLFLDRELAEKMDPREDRTSAIRSGFLSILSERISTVDPNTRPDGPPALPPLSLSSGSPTQDQPPSASPGAGQANGESSHLSHLPVFNFDKSTSQVQGQALPTVPAHLQDIPLGRSLSPIVERTHSQSLSGDVARSRSATEENQPLASLISSPSAAPEGEETGSRYGLPISTSPPPATVEARHPSGDSQRRPSDSRHPNGQYSQSRSETTGSGGVEIMGVKLPFTPATSPEIPSFSTTSTSVCSSQASPLGTQAPPFQLSASPGPPYSPPGAPTPGDPSVTRSPVPGSPSFSALTSPHSVEKDLPSISAVQAQAQDTPRRLSSPPLVPRRSPGRNVISNVPAVPPVPDKPSSPPHALQQQVPAPPAKPVPAQDAQNENDFAAALFYMQQFEDKPHPPRRVPTTISEYSDVSGSGEEAAQPSTQTHSMVSGRFASPLPAAPQQQRRGPESEHSTSGSRPPIGRKPSGARALPTASRALNPDTLSHSPPSPDVHRTDLDAMPNPSRSTLSHAEDPNADALAALSFLDSTPAAEQPPPSRADVSTAKPVPSPPPRDDSPQPSDEEPAPTSTENATQQYRSSFALSKQAAERKARMQAQQAAHQAAVHRPGRANGKRPISGPRSSGWNESSDEEEEEEDDDDEDADSDEGPSVTDHRRPPSQVHAQVTAASVAAPVPAPAPAAPIRPLRPQSRNASPAEVATATDANPYAQLRHPRNLPPVPRPQTQGPPSTTDDFYTAPPRRIISEQRARTPDDGAIPRPHSDFPMQRQNIWTQVLEPGRQPGANPLPEPPPPPQRDTFVQLEPASVSMTKAFTPHGLLSAGMQDKQDRSAKRQEELARETGASLINVPNKPPPPQTGLLGAITAHERERKREGGMGAALTEREREKRMAEDRQRKLDDLQRQQLEMAQSGMFTGQPYPNFNPMMANPMMMGMNPMMPGGFMGYPNMMPGYGPQQYMFAQQAAQAAYQQAMMAFSTAGSQAPNGMTSGASPITPMMTGGGMGFDPRMSMMGMPIMGSPMPMGSMGLPMGTMGTMGPMGGGVGMQMTGGSTFDPRLSTGPMDENMRPPAPGGQHGPGHNSPRNSSAGQGSPAGPRPVDPRDGVKS